MKGKISIVTGANGGLGASVTRAFLQAGATVVGVAPRIKPSDFPHPDFVALAAEINSLESAKDIAGQVISRFGRIDVLLHLVGGFAGGQPVPEVDDATWKRMLDVNLNAAFHIARAVLPPMQKARAGRIIAIGSRAALEPGPNLAAYNVSKAAMVALFRTIALENKHLGITANVVLPGTMDTPGNRAAMPAADFSKWVRTANVAELILLLAGDAGGDITGAAIPIYGGDF